MRKRSTFVFLFAACLIMAVLPVNADQHSEQTTDANNEMSLALPVVVVGEPRFEFKPVIEGTVVTHDFIIGNAGTASLSIEKVVTGCGCATVNYTKIVQPGTEGKISINGNTGGYAGRSFSKTITVYTNDPRQKQFSLSFSGQVERFALIKPERVILRGAAGNKIQSVVSITPEKKYPFNIVESHSDNLEKKVDFTLEKKEDKYLCTVNNLMETSGNYHGKIYLKTDSSVKPEIIIYVYGAIEGNKS